MNYVQNFAQEGNKNGSLPLRGEIGRCLALYQRQGLLNLPFLDKQEEYRLLQDSKDSCDKKASRAKDKLVRHFFKLIFSNARKFFIKSNGKLELEDFIAQGSLGFIKSVEKFDLAKWGKSENGHPEVRLGTYAKWWIRESMHSYLIKNISIIKFYTTKNDIKIFNNLGRAMQKLDIAKDTFELSNHEIHQLAVYLNVDCRDILKHVTGINNIIRLDDDDTEEDKIGIPEKEGSYKNLDDTLDHKKAYGKLTKEEKEIYRNFCEKNKTLQQIACEQSSNRETIRQRIHKIAKKLNLDKKKLQKKNNVPSYQLKAS